MHRIRRSRAATPSASAECGAPPRASYCNVGCYLHSAGPCYCSTDSVDHPAITDGFRFGHRRARPVRPVWPATGMGARFAHRHRAFSVPNRRCPRVRWWIPRREIPETDPASVAGLITKPQVACRRLSMLGALLADLNPPVAHIKRRPWLCTSRVVSDRAPLHAGFGRLSRVGSALRSAASSVVRCARQCPTTPTRTALTTRQ